MAKTKRKIGQFKMFAVNTGEDVLIGKKRPTTDISEFDGRSYWTSGEDKVATSVCRTMFERASGLELPVDQVVRLQFSIKPVAKKKKLKA